MRHNYVPHLLHMYLYFIIRNTDHRQTDFYMDSAMFCVCFRLIRQHYQVPTIQQDIHIEEPRDRPSNNREWAA